MSTHLAFGYGDDLAPDELDWIELGVRASSALWNENYVNPASRLRQITRRHLAAENRAIAQKLNRRPRVMTARTMLGGGV